MCRNKSFLLFILCLSCTWALRGWHITNIGTSNSKYRYLSNFLRTKDIIDTLYLATAIQSLSLIGEKSIERSRFTRNVGAFSTLLQALEIYKGVNNGSLLVPSTFKVPFGSDIWPSNLWGFPLGRRVVDTRCKKIHKSEMCRDMLDSLGFVWDPSREKMYRTLDCIRVYLRKYPDKRLQSSFIVPHGEMGWPAQSGGYRLGAAVRRLKSKKDLMQNVSETRIIEELLMSCEVLNSEKTFKVSEDDLIHLVRIFGEQYSHVDIPSNFKVPSSYTWPEHLWGLRLGSRIADIKRGKSGNQELRIALHALGISPSDENSRMLRFERGSFNETIRALSVYKKMYGNLMVPSSFRVPQETSNTPWAILGESNAGLRLGNRVNAIRAASEKRRLSPRVREVLNAMGFVWRATEYKYQTFISVLEIFQATNGHIEVPRTFVVPGSGEASKIWPKFSRGYKLGSQLRRLRKGSLFSEKQRLALAKRFPKIAISSESSTEYGPISCLSDGTPFHLFYKSLVYFQSKYGHTYVPTSFVVPGFDEDLPSEDWPVECRGYKLGKVCKKVRKLGEVDFLLFASKIKEENNTSTIREKEFDIRKHQALDMLHELSFSFLSTTELKFERVCKALLTHRRLFGDMDVPRYFVVPKVDDDWPPECLGMRLGLRVRDIKAGLAYRGEKYTKVLFDIGFFASD